MKRNSKGMLSIFVMAILALSFALPFASVSAALSEPDLDKISVNVGDTITVSGDPGNVTSGATIKVYWDVAIGDNAWLLNTTEGNPDGSYDVEVDVPDTLNGTHWIWVEDTATQARAKSADITVSRKVKLKPSRGLAGDKFTVDGTGFSDENDITLVFWNVTGGSGDVNYTKTYTETPTTDEYGSFTVELTVPSDLAGVENYGAFFVNASDDVSVLNETATYIVGPSIVLTPDEGPVGTVIEITGAGFDGTQTLSVGDIIWDDTYSIPIVDAPIDIASNGKFSCEIVAPSWPIGTYEVNVTDGGVWANETFTIDGLASIEVSPTYGSPGATITVLGYNFTQIAGTEVALTMTSTPVSNLVKVDTEADGTFETTFVSPAVLFGTYKVYANDTVYDVDAADTFKVGIIAFIINPTFGEAGTKVAVTGIGFEDGLYNLTFGDETYDEYGTVAAEAISDDFYIPNVEPGVYDLTVIDSEENELTAQFTVTESTYVTMDPPLAPNEYNVTIEGYNFADKADEVDFVLYNSTDEWDMTVWKNATSTIPVETNTDGNFTGLWQVFEEDILSLGDYTVNVTGSEGLLVQVPFSIVEARVSVTSRKALFDRGDAIQFDINNDFKLPDSYIEIYSPGDVLYWSTELFKDAYWMLVEGLYTVPYYRQTDPVGNSMELQTDAPMGTWLYIFYDGADDQLMNGTFVVGPSTAAQVDQRLTELWGSIEGLTEDIGEITSEIGDDIAALSGEIDDVVADVQDMVNDITSDLAGELAQVAEDTEAAVADLEDSIGDIADAQNDLASELDAVSQDTTAAREAAEDAQQSAQGLTTLVYGAIGASLIAALAAIVSLMQISKKIA